MTLNEAKQIISNKQKELIEKVNQAIKDFKMPYSDAQISEDYCYSFVDEEGKEKVAYYLGKIVVKRKSIDNLLSISSYGAKAFDEQTGLDDYIYHGDFKNIEILHQYIDNCDMQLHTELGYPVLTSEEE